MDPTAKGADLSALREKWRTVPAVNKRYASATLLSLPDREFLEIWRGNFELPERRWYRSRYAPLLRGKRCSI